MIGKHYEEQKYNCAHFFADWYREKLNVEIPVINAGFDIAFVFWLRRNFHQVTSPVENCLVLMDNRGSRHVGVYADYGVYHNYKGREKHGAVVHWTLGMIRNNYQQVSYWVWSQSSTMKTRSQDNL